jgi:hypothetical protein
MWGLRKMADGGHVKLRQPSRHSLIVATALLIGAALAAGPAAVVAAEKSKRDSSSSSSSSSGASKSSSSSGSSKSRSTSSSSSAAARSSKDSTGNKSVRTQQLAGDALAAKLGTTAGPTSRPSEGSDDLRDRLSSVDASIRAEDERHEAAVARLQKSASTAQGRKALEKEQASYKQRLASLNEQRQSLLVKLDDAPAASATTEPSTAKKPAPVARKR